MVKEVRAVFLLNVLVRAVRVAFALTLLLVAAALLCRI